MRTLILSDLHADHLGSRLSRYQARLTRLAARFDRLVVNGDAFECVAPLGAGSEAAGHMDELRVALRPRGGEPEFLTGNHDPAVSACHGAYFEEPGLLAFHGDIIGDCASPWVSREAEFRRIFRAEVHAFKGNLDFRTRSEMFRRIQIECRARWNELPSCSRYWYVARQLLIPTRLWRIYTYRRSAPGLVSEMAGRFGRPVRCVSFGHTHSPGRWQVGPLTLYNTGSFMPLSQPYALIVEGAEVHWTPLDQLLRLEGCR